MNTFGVKAQQKIAMTLLIARNKAVTGRHNTQAGLGAPVVTGRSSLSGQITCPMHRPTGTRSRRQSQQNSGTGSTTGATGAFVGIGRSAADTGAVMLVKLNKHANPIARMLRRIAHPCFKITYTIPGPERAVQAAVSRFPI